MKTLEVNMIQYVENSYVVQTKMRSIESDITGILFNNELLKHSSHTLLGTTL